MDECVFCKIVKGELPCYKVYEDDYYLVFLDIKPLNPGNSLLIPKKHYRWVTDVPDFGQYFETAKKIALATQAVVKSDYTTFVTFGTDVAHAHIRIVPRFYNDHHHEGINALDTVNITGDKMMEIANNIYKLIRK
jgi:histidine triad (HIT) family protein